MTKDVLVTGVIAKYPILPIGNFRLCHVIRWQTFLPFGMGTDWIAVKPETQIHQMGPKRRVTPVCASWMMAESPWPLFCMLPQEHERNSRQNKAKHNRSP